MQHPYTYSWDRPNSPLVGDSGGVIPDATIGGAASTGFYPDGRQIINLSGLQQMGVTGRGTLSKTAKNAAATQLTCAAMGSTIPIIYGEPRVGGRVANAMVSGPNWVFWVIWGEGEVDSFTDVQMNDAALPAGASVTNYTGTPTGAVDSTLAAAFLANGVSGFSEALPAVAYSVFVVPFKQATSVPSFAAVIKGQRVYDPRDGTQTLGTWSTYKWSDNPSLILADFLASTVWGAGLTPIWSTVATCANANDVLLGTVPNQEKTRVCDLVIATDATVDNWIESLRTAAAVFLVNNQGQVKFVPDADGAPVATYVHDSGQIIAITNFAIRDSSSLPTVIEVEYTDDTVTPWQTISCDPAERPGLSTNSIPYRKSVVQMPWIRKRSQANREAIERLNKLWLRAIGFTVDQFDEGLQHEPGDLVAYTYPEAGISALATRVLSVVPTAQGWQLQVEKHDAGAYSDVVQAAPSAPITNLPSPGSPPTVTGLTVAEEVYQLQTGRYASRLRANWTAIVWPFLDRYRITVTQGTNVIATASVESTGTTYATGPVQEGVPYQIGVEVISTTGAAGTAAAATLTPAGKNLIPGDVPTLTGFEAGGKVYLYITAAIDLDITLYEFRYGLTSGTWATATLIDRVAALSYVANGIPAGPWRFYVKAIDSVRQYSTNAKTLDLTVTLDANAFLLGTKVFDDIGAPTLTSMTAYTARPDPKTYYVTDFGNVLGYGQTDTNDSTGTFADLDTVDFADPHTAGASTFLTQAWDMGLSLTGNITGSIVYTDLSGTASYWLETSPDNATWTQWTGGTAKTTCRYVRLRLQTTGSILVQSGASVRMDAYPRTENGSVTTAATGATTITLSYKYASAKAILLTPQGIVSMQAVFDNVVLSTSGANSFDVYLFNSAGAQIAGTVSWQFQGV